MKNLIKAMDLSKTFEGKLLFENAFFDVFIDNFSPIQVMPYAFGFLLVLGFLLFFASLLNVGNDRQRPLEVMGIILAAVYGSLIIFNYIIQVAYVPNALDQNKVVLSFLAMANPKSLPWAIEMFGYGILGLATLVVAPLFSSRGLQRIIRWLLILNGIVSVGGAVAIVDFVRGGGGHIVGAPEEASVRAPCDPGGSAGSCAAAAADLVGCVQVGRSSEAGESAAELWRAGAICCSCRASDKGRDDE